MTGKTADGSGDCTIINRIWSLIWDSKSRFYLPKVARNGLKIPAFGIDIPPFNQFAVPDIPKITMFKEPVLGYMSIQLSDSEASGISSISGANLQCNDGSSSKTKFSFDFRFSSLTLSGNYTVDAGGGIGGCAIAATAAILGGHAFDGMEGVHSLEGISQDGPELALWYQDPLGESTNGQELIGAYYDNQDSILDLQNENQGQNPYTQSLQAVNVHQTTESVYSATNHYRQSQIHGVEAQSASAPRIGSSSQYSSGQLPYAYLIAMARQKANLAEGADANRFAQLASDMTHFIGSISWYQTTYPGEQPIGGSEGVLERIANADPNEIDAYIEERAVLDFLEPEAVASLPSEVIALLDGYRPEPAGHERWRASYAERVATDKSGNDSVDGHYSDKDMKISGSLSGTLALVGGNLTVSITSLDATVHSVDIVIEQTRGWWPGLYNKVVNWLANDTFLKGAIKKGLSDGLSSDSMKSNLEELLNGALKSL